MEPAAYRDLAANEGRHWWYAGRRAIAGAEIRGLGLRPQARICEIGCGTGGNLALLARFGAVTGVEPDAAARSFAAARRTRAQVVDGALPDRLPLAAGAWDLVCLFDCLEHIDDDRAALAAARDLLAPGGAILLTVPAHPWLWSAHDEFLHHRRRYTRRGLAALAAACGLRPARLTYWNAALFPAAAAARLAGSRGGTATPPAAINRALLRLLLAERRWLHRRQLAWGLSLLAVLRPASG